MNKDNFTVYELTRDEDESMEDIRKRIEEIKDNLTVYELARDKEEYKSIERASDMKVKDIIRFAGDYFADLDKHVEEEAQKAEDEYQDKKDSDEERGVAEGFDPHWKDIVSLPNKEKIDEETTKDSKEVKDRNPNYDFQVWIENQKNEEIQRREIITKEMYATISSDIMEGVVDILKNVKEKLKIIVYQV